MPQPYAKTIEDIGKANTSLVWHNNRLLALFEQDKPYVNDNDQIYFSFKCSHFCRTYKRCTCATSYELSLDSLETQGRVETFGDKIFA